MTKKILALVMAMAMILVLLTGCGSTTTSDGADASAAADTEYAVAMITDSGDITDQSFNQTTYEASKAFCEENDLDFNYYKPTEDSTDARVASVELAIDDGYNVIVMPGYLFAGTIVEVAEEYPDVKFIALDCSKGDLLEAAVGEDYDYNPDNWDLEDYIDLSNVYCAIYQEELSGYMAGYAAVKLGYTGLGFMGGMAVPAVMRYGYGFIQGANAAAAETDADVTIQYRYSGTFGCGNSEVVAACDTMYANGAEVIFACGGSVYKDVCESAEKNDGYVIGVDSDQADSIAADYPGLEGKVITSAMKGLAPTVQDTLDDVINNGNWDDYSAKIDTLGMENADDPTANYCQIAPSTQYNEDFTEDDYAELVAAIVNGDLEVSNDISGDAEDMGPDITVETAADVL